MRPEEPAQLSYRGSGISDPAVVSLAMRSSKRMEGLLLAETGAAFVQLDPLGGGSGFHQGSDPTHASASPSGDVGSCPIERSSSRESIAGNERNGAQLLELQHRRSDARVEVDLLLDGQICVEGGQLRGRIRLKVRKPGKKDTSVLIGEGKVRLIGFEAIPGVDSRHMFYQHAASLQDIAMAGDLAFRSTVIDEEGYSPAQEGIHVVPFVMAVPKRSEAGSSARGSFENAGAMVKYIAVASFKLKDDVTKRRSIAHFYRYFELFPSLDRSHVLAPSSNALFSTASGGLFLGGVGRVTLTACVNRSVWVAGQQCFVQLVVENGSRRKWVKGIALSLVRTITVFRPRPHLDLKGDDDEDACQTSTAKSVVAHAGLQACQRGLKGLVTAKGWWEGVAPGERRHFTHFVQLPPDALSIMRVRLVEVQYAIKVVVGGSSLFADELSVVLPITIVNHVSLDPTATAVRAEMVPQRVLKEAACDVKTNEHSTRTGAAMQLGKLGNGRPSVHPDRRPGTAADNAPGPVSDQPKKGAVHSLGPDGRGMPLYVKESVGSMCATQGTSIENTSECTSDEEVSALLLSTRLDGGQETRYRQVSAYAGGTGHVTSSPSFPPHKAGEARKRGADNDIGSDIDRDSPSLASPLFSLQKQKAMRSTAAEHGASNLLDETFPEGPYDRLEALKAAHCRRVHAGTAVTDEERARILDITLCKLRSQTVTDAEVPGGSQANASRSALGLGLRLGREAKVT